MLLRLEAVNGNPYVIVGAVNGQPVTDLEKPWRRIREKAGMPEVRIHDLRHTYASNAIASGFGLEMVGKLLGHANVQTTARYAHLADGHIREAAATLASGLAGHLATPVPVAEPRRDNVVAFPGKPKAATG